jgi:hypothetical protein
MRAIVDPAIADIQVEHRQAMTQGRACLAWWRVVAGMTSLLIALAQETGMRWCRDAGPWTMAERRRLVGVLVVVAAVTSAATILLASAIGWHQGLLLYSLPQGVPVALPVGLVFGTLLGLKGQRIGIRLGRALMALVLAAGVASAATAFWLVPAANQAFREEIVRRLPEPQRSTVHLIPGPNEMTWGELRHRLSEPAWRMVEADRRALQVSYHVRFALAGAAIVLPLLGLASPSRQRRGWVVLGAGAFGICATYYALLWVAEYAVRNEGAPVVAMWCPNLVVGAGAALLLITERPRDNDGCLLPGSEP